MLVVFDYRIISFLIGLCCVAGLDKFDDGVKFIQCLDTSPTPHLQSAKVRVEFRETLVLRGKLGPLCRVFILLDAVAENLYVADPLRCHDFQWVVCQR